MQEFEADEALEAARWLAAPDNVHFVSGSLLRARVACQLVQRVTQDF